MLRIHSVQVFPPQPRYLRHFVEIDTEQSRNQIKSQDVRIYLRLRWRNRRNCGRMSDFEILLLIGDKHTSKFHSLINKSVVSFCWKEFIDGFWIKRKSFFVKWNTTEMSIIDGGWRWMQHIQATHKFSVHDFHLRRLYSADNVLNVRDKSSIINYMRTKYQFYIRFYGTIKSLPLYYRETGWARAYNEWKIVDEYADSTLTNAHVCAKWMMV